MAEDSRSPLAPVEAMSFRACVAVGAGLGLLVVALVGGLGPASVGDRADPRGGPAPSDDEAAAGASTLGAGERESAAADGDDARSTAGEPGAERDSGRGEPDPNDDAGDDADGDMADDGDEAADGGDDDAGGESGDGAEGELGDGADGASGDGAGDAGSEDASAPDAAVAATTDGGDDPRVDDDAGDSGGGASERDVDGLPPSRQPDAESTMTAEELREAAKIALAEKRYRDAYRLATRSDYKERSETTLVIKGKAACGLKDDKAAKAAIKRLPRGDERRKDIRGFCRDRGVRVGL